MGRADPVRKCRTRSVVVGRDPNSNDDAVRYRDRQPPRRLLGCRHLWFTNPRVLAGNDPGAKRLDTGGKLWHSTDVPADKTAGQRHCPPPDGLTFSAS